MFFKKKAIIYLERNGFEVFVEDSTNPFKFEFSPEEVSNLEITNSSSLSEKIKAFIDQNKLTLLDIILITAENITFQKASSLTDPKTKETEVTNFLSELPFDPKKLTKKVIKVNEGSIILAINKEFYKVLKDEFEKERNSILYVISDILFKSLPIDYKNVKEVFKYKKTISEWNLITKDNGGKNMTTNKKVILSLIFFALALALLLFVLFKFVLGSKKIEQPATETTTTTTEITETTESAKEASPAMETEESKAPKENLKVKVLNGSGVTGLASKVKEQLVKIGFKEITTGNAPESAIKTVVTFNTKVSSQIQNEVTDLLKKEFESVEVTQKENSDLDIEITLGNLLTEK